VIPRYGRQGDTAVGYNPQKPGRPSHHPLACVIGSTRLCLHMEWRKGNTVSSSGWIEAMGKVWRSPIARHCIRLNRGDIGFGQEAVMAWHEQGEGRRPSYLFKLKLTANVKKAIAKVPWDDWQGKSNEGLVQIYRQRADAENVFDELKNQWGFSGFCSQKAAVSQSSARLLLLVYNLWSLFVRVVKNQGGHTEAIRSRYELLLIPGKLVLSGRRKIVKLAVGGKFANFLKQAYRRLEEWLSRTAPQLDLTIGKSPPWLLFDPAHASPSPAT
jgi:hypothetical protein